MATGPMRGMLRHLRRASTLRDAADLTDGQLLERFLARRDEAAFEALLRRHGPMVLGVCRRVLGNAADADDAFQATFFVLVRKARSIRPRELVGNWLHGVAYRTALRARSAAALRRAKERQVPPMASAEPPSDDAWRELQPLLDRELNGLPEKYRVPILLCDLQGKTRREAARQLGWPEGTLSCRLARGRALLARRLTRHGVSLSGAGLALGLVQEATAAVPAALLAVTTQTILAGAAPAGVTVLAEGVLKAMLWTRLKGSAALVLALGMVIGGVSELRSPAAVPGPPEAGKAAAPAAVGPAPRKTYLVRGNDDPKEWKLDFRFHDPRPVWVETPGRGRALYWYLRYEVSNRTPAAHTFVPQFDLVLPGQAENKQSLTPPGVKDLVLPGVHEAIARREDPTGGLKLKTSANITAEPLPPPLPGAPPRGVQGLAVWEGVPADVKEFTVFVSGLTNTLEDKEMSVVGPKTRVAVRRQELRLHFRREGGVMRFVPPGEWVFRTCEIRVKQRPQYVEDPQTVLDRQRTRELVERQHLPLTRREVVALTVQQTEDMLRRLREQTGDAKAEMDALDEIERALKDLRRRRQDQRKALEKLQGLWLPKKLDFGGRVVPLEILGGGVSPPSAVAIVGDHYLTRAGKDPQQVPTIRLDPHSKPARIDFHIGGQIHRATYELQGDTLRIRIGDSTLTYQRKKL